MIKTCYIYSLESDGLPFYIGKTIDLIRREKEHIKYSKGWNGNYQGMYEAFPEFFSINIVDEVPDDEWEFWEKHYISLYKSWGMQLLNKHEGGNWVKEKKIMSSIIYCKCEKCLEYFIVAKRRRYCTSKCRYAAQYKRIKGRTTDSCSVVS